MVENRSIDLLCNRFPEQNKTLDFTTFSSLLRISTKYEMPAVRSHSLDVVRDAYPEKFEGVKITWGDRFQRTESSSKRSPQSFHPAETHISTADGILHGGPKGVDFVDGQTFAQERLAGSGGP